MWPVPMATVAPPTSIPIHFSYHNRVGMVRAISPHHEGVGPLQELLLGPCISKIPNCRGKIIERDYTQSHTPTHSITQPAAAHTHTHTHCVGFFRAIEERVGRKTLFLLFSDCVLTYICSFMNQYLPDVAVPSSFDLSCHST